MCLPNQCGRKAATFRFEQITIDVSYHILTRPTTLQTCSGLPPEPPARPTSPLQRDSRLRLLCRQALLGHRVLVHRIQPPPALLLAEQEAGAQVLGGAARGRELQGALREWTRGKR